MEIIIKFFKKSIKKIKEYIKKINEEEENEFFEFLKSDIDKTVFPVKYQIVGVSGNEKSWLPIRTMVFFNKKIYDKEEFNNFKYKDEIVQSRIDLEEYMIQYIFNNTSKEVESIESWYDSSFYTSLTVKLKNGETCDYWIDKDSDNNKETISRLKNCIAFILNEDTQL